MVRKSLLLMAAFSLLLAAGSQEEPETDEGDSAEAERTTGDPRLVNPGQLTVGTGDPVYPPWMLNDDPASGEGFENAMIYALAEELGFSEDEVVWERGLTFDQTIAPGPKPFDFAIRQVSVTDEREEIVDFSMVYFQPDKVVVALPDSEVAEATSFEELREASWGATIGTTDLDYLEDILEVQDAAVFDDQAGTFQALQGGQIDATVVALPTGIFATDVQVPEAEITAILPPDPDDNGHGLLFEDGNSLVDWIDDGLEAIIERGVIDDLIEEYLIDTSEVPEITS
ncbi:MAG: substrate-binding periplasmic protein [Spirochaetales bacterium]